MMHSPGSKVGKIAHLSLLLALALGLSLVESTFFPPLGVPGAKWGLANIVSLLALLWLGLREAALIVALRVVLTGIFSGTFLGLGFWLSAAGAAVALLVMAALLKAPGFGLLGISIAGAAGHNLAQLGVYAVVVNSAGVFYLLPPLLAVSLLTGSLTGIIVNKLSQYKSKE